MSNIQGKGKVRLIAKKGRYAESGYTETARRMVLSGKLSKPIFGGIMGAGSEAFKKGSPDAAVADVGRGDYFVEFDVTPDITESGSTNYYEESGLRGPASVLMYMGSPSRSFSINAKLVARNRLEARKVIAQINILKSWRMPESYTGGFVQTPPAILLLQGYGKMFKDIPVVMTELSIELSSEYDSIISGEDTFDFGGNVSEGEDGDPNEEIKYRPGAFDGTGSKENVKQLETVTATASRIRSVTLSSSIPIIVPITISLREVHNVEDETGINLNGLSTFDILKYRTGNLEGW